MRKREQVIYYHDEQNDEFAGDAIVAKRIDGSYRYVRDGFWGRCAHIFWYRIVAIPLAKCYMKLHFHHRVIGREVLRQAPGGYCMFGNHTHPLADALIPALVNRPTDVYTIVHPNNVSMLVLGRITPYLGAMPLPDDAEAAKHFVRAVGQRISQKHCIMIYPEAHIWPYYTGIRPFADTSFRYPVQYKVPVFCLTNTYQRRGAKKTPQIVTYIDGPFYADTKKSAGEQKRALRDQVYAVMKERAKQSNVELIRYVRAEDDFVS